MRIFNRGNNRPETNKETSPTRDGVKVGRFVAGVGMMVTSIFTSYDYLNDDSLTPKEAAVAVGLQEQKIADAEKARENARSNIGRACLGVLDLYLGNGATFSNVGEDTAVSDISTIATDRPCGSAVDTRLAYRNLRDSNRTAGGTIASAERSIEQIKGELRDAENQLELWELLGINAAIAGTAGAISGVAVYRIEDQKLSPQSPQ